MRRIRDVVRIGIGRFVVQCQCHDYHRTCRRQWFVNMHLLRVTKRSGREETQVAKRVLVVGQAAALLAGLPQQPDYHDALFLAN